MLNDSPRIMKSMISSNNKNKTFKVGSPFPHRFRTTSAMATEDKPLYYRGQGGPTHKLEWIEPKVVLPINWGGLTSCSFKAAGSPLPKIPYLFFLRKGV